MVTSSTLPNFLSCSTWKRGVNLVLKNVWYPAGLSLQELFNCPEHPVSGQVVKNTIRTPMINNLYNLHTITKRGNDTCFVTGKSPWQFPPILTLLRDLPFQSTLSHVPLYHDSMARVPQSTYYFQQYLHK